MAEGLPMWLRLTVEFGTLLMMLCFLFTLIYLLFTEWER